MPPVASFTANPYYGGYPLSVQFTDTSTNTPTWWQWNFGDGTSNSTLENPNHAYTYPGNYTVMLTAGNAAGNTTGVFQYIQVLNQTNTGSGSTSTGGSGPSEQVLIFTTLLLVDIGCCFLWAFHVRAGDLTCLMGGAGAGVFSMLLSTVITSGGVTIMGSPLDNFLASALGYMLLVGLFMTAMGLLAYFNNKNQPRQSRGGYYTRTSTRRRYK
jgi:hypothetical protein